LIAYLDTSALVKLYVQEPGTQDVRTIIQAARAVATSWVAYAETRSAFARILREGVTSPEHHQARVRQFNQDWPSYLRVELLPAIARNSGELAELHGLRGFDATHLASALWLGDQVSCPFGFATYDRRLKTAGEQAGLISLP
jgi:predicted nucleic acid-binding protein